MGRRWRLRRCPANISDRDTARAAAAAGIRWLFTSEPQTGADVVDRCEVYGRFTLRRDSAATVARALVSSHPTARVSQWLEWNAKKLAKRAGGDGYLKRRASLYGDRPSP